MNSELFYRIARKRKILKTYSVHSLWNFVITFQITGQAFISKYRRWQIGTYFNAWLGRKCQINTHVLKKTRKCVEIILSKSLTSKVRVLTVKVNVFYIIFLVYSSLDMSELAKQAKKKLQAVSVWPSYFFSCHQPSCNQFLKC